MERNLIEITGYWRTGFPVIVDYGDGIQDFRIYLRNGMSEWRLCSNIEAVLEKEESSEKNSFNNVIVQTMSGKVYKIGNLMFTSDQWLLDQISNLYGPQIKGVPVTKEEFLRRFS